jgi:threonine/homoserine/homoserine lactone efflux protein
LRQGLLCNLGNPKIAILFTSLLPQFVPDGSATLLSFLALGSPFAVMGFTWLCCFALLVDRAGGVFRRGGVRRAIDAIAGTVLVAFGARLATEPL